MSSSKTTTKFYMEPHLGGVMGTLSETLPDERPITDIAVVEHANKCPAGFWPVMKTYDEDSDADLWRQSIMFKKTCRYLCLSKSEEFSPGMAVSSIRVVASSDPPPRGYSYAALTHDTGARAWRKRKLCFLLSKLNEGVQGGIQTPPITDIILCSRLKKAPEGFQYAGEISGMVLCFKVGGTSNGPSPVHAAAILSSPRLHPDIAKLNVNGSNTNYENVVTDVSKRMVRVPPERPPKTSALVAELNSLNLHENGSPSPGKKNQKLPEDASNDYEQLSLSYSLQPSRPAPRAPIPPRPAPRGMQRPALVRTQTLGSWCGIDGVPFQLNSKLGGFSQGYGAQLPVIKKKSKFLVDQEYMYSFRIERQT